MNKNKLKIFTVIIPFIAAGLIAILKLHTAFFISLLPKVCLFNYLTGYQCPGCGNTRSVLSILRLDFISAVKFNITPVLLMIIVILLYVELFTAAFFKHKKLLPRKLSFWIGVIIIMCIYYIVRNFI